jgi:endogenous inhibitor of DNA gyrase (YacG/DUF329 family)
VSEQPRIPQASRITFQARCPGCNHTVTWEQRSGRPSEPDCNTCPELDAAELHS